ncbi:MAG: ABC transporter ATP-binding protein [Saprospiraceae bacterium]|nr:ABC transporter ATP-binding protein [Saprospiraceae bacterium]
MKNLNFHYSSGKVYGISGSNGSGKTTLLSLIAGTQIPTSGYIQYLDNKQNLVPNHLWFQYLSYAAPYGELYEYLTVSEITYLFGHLKGFSNELSAEEVMGIAWLDHKSNELTKNLSSGMKQRLKLALTILSGSDILILDEPRTNLDTETQSWYNDLLLNYKSDRIVIIASNDSADFEICDFTLNLNEQ